jgi:hypothetical protein
MVKGNLPPEELRRTESPAPLLRFLSPAACVFLAATLLGYAGLIGQGRWQIDEFMDFYRMRSGVGYVFARLAWSPRPISEPLYYAYGCMVNWLHRPLIVPFLAALWAVFFVAGLYTAWQRRAEGQPGRVLDCALIALTLMSLFAADADVTEVFYWPAGAIAYLLTLSATLLLFLQVADGRLAARQGRILGAICLVVAAGSSEAGATFVLCYALLYAAGWAVANFRNRKHSGGPSPALWLAIPSLLCAMVLVSVRLNRFKAQELSGSVPGPALGHPVRSLILGVQRVGVEFLGRPMLADLRNTYPHPQEWLHLGSRLLLESFSRSRLPMEILLAIGTALWGSARFRRPSKPAAWQILGIVAALPLASLFTVAAAELHFGVICCQRHEVLRESWMIMAVTGAAIACLAWIPEKVHRWMSQCAPVAPLCFCAALLSLRPFSPLMRSYENYATAWAAERQTFASGFSAGENEITYCVLPSAGVISEEQLPLGTYSNQPLPTSAVSYAAYPYYVMDFFAKNRLAILPAAQCMRTASLPGERTGTNLQSGNDPDFSHFGSSQGERYSAAAGAGKQSLEALESALDGSAAGNKNASPTRPAP